VIFRETRHHAQAHVTSGALVHCALSLAARRTQMAEQYVDFAGQCLLWLLLLRLPAVVVVLLLLLPPPPPQNNLLTLPLLHLTPESVSVTKISLMASASSFIYFFQTLLETHNHLPCLLYYV